MFTAIFIFIVIFLVYLHWAEQYKTGDDLEIYEMDYTDNEELQTVCKSKQPITFEFSSILSKFHFLNTISLEDLADKYGKMDIYIKDTDDYWTKDTPISPIPLSLETSLKLISTDTHSHYISEENHELINDTALEKYYDSLHEFIKPSFTIHKQFDLYYGSRGSATPLRYNTEYSHFIYIPKGKIRVKMTPHKSKKYLHHIKDYYSYEFYSPINIWNCQPEYTNDFERIQFLDFDVHQGHFLFIPPYWWYSIKYEDEGTFLYSLKYNTIMNVVANTHNISQYLYHQYTTKTKPAKLLKINEREQKTEEINVPII